MKEQGINIFTEGVKFSLTDKNEFDKWINNVIESEGKSAGIINFIFCNDDYLLKLNREFLNHDYFTDIVTFDNSESENEITGDIYISLERVRENALKMSESVDRELSRVVVHGVLHLIGYNDSNKKEIIMMRKKEDQYITKIEYRIL